MIFKIDTRIFDTCAPEHISELVCEMMKNKHYIECQSSRVYDRIVRAIQTHASSLQKEMFMLYDRFSIDQFHRNMYTVIDVSDFSYDQLFILAGKSAILLPENTLEWPVYIHIIETYKKDWNVRDVAQVLSDLITSEVLTCAQVGGFGEFKNQIPFLQKGLYHGLLHYKCCVITDRDVDADEDASGNWNWPNSRHWLFTMLTGKPMPELVKEDVYSLNQSHYHWHMWYKRAIENYFPDKAFTSLGLDLTTFNASSLDRDYRPSSLIKRYSKNDIKRLTYVMGLRDYESGLKKFYINDYTYSEFELLLMKIIRIV